MPNRTLVSIQAETAEEFEKNIAGMTRNFMENRSNTSVKVCV